MTNRCPELYYVFYENGASDSKCKAIEEGRIQDCPKSTNKGQVRERCWGRGGTAGQSAAVKP